MRRRSITAGVKDRRSRYPDDNFSVRWTKADNFPGGTIRFTATMDDGMRVWLDNNLIIDSWYPSEEHTMTRDVYVSPGIHELRWSILKRAAWPRPCSPMPRPAAAASTPTGRANTSTTSSLGGVPVLVRDDRYLNQFWGTDSPAPGIVSPDYWSARWTRTLNVPAGTYNVGVRTLTTARGFTSTTSRSLIIGAPTTTRPTPSITAMPAARWPCAWNTLMSCAVR